MFIDKYQLTISIYYFYIEWVSTDSYNLYQWIQYVTIIIGISLVVKCICLVYKM